MTTQNKIEEPKEETANSDQIHDLLNESHALLHATANFESEPSTIDQPQNTTEFISDDEKNCQHIIYKWLNNGILKRLCHERRTTPRKRAGSVSSLIFRKQLNWIRLLYLRSQCQISKKQNLRQKNRKMTVMMILHLLIHLIHQLTCRIVITT